MRERMNAIPVNEMPKDERENDVIEVTDDMIQDVPEKSGVRPVDRKSVEARDAAALAEAKKAVGLPVPEAASAEQKTEDAAADAAMEASEERANALADLDYKISEAQRDAGKWADTLKDLGVDDPVGTLAGRALKGGAGSKIGRAFGKLFSTATRIRENALDAYDAASKAVADLQAARNEEAKRLSGDANYKQAKGMSGRQNSRLGSGEGRSVERK